MASRVRIAALGLADEAEFLAAAAASRELHGRWVNPPSSGEVFREKVQRMQGPVSYAFTARRIDSGALVGYVEVTQVVLGGFCSGYMGYYAFAGHERQGLMTEALRLVIRHMFGQLGLHRLEANIQPGNLASIALVRACGFHREGFSPRYLKIAGRWRDHERWALLADEPAGRRHSAT
jgi:[ribosomal protein S5]-alanine N-acetyltransferase